MSMTYALLLTFFLCIASVVQAKELILGARSEITHPGKGHEIHMSGAAVAVAGNGETFVAWTAQEGQTNNLYLARPGMGETKPVRINPPGMAVDSLHQSPDIALGPAGEIYVSWSSTKSKPEDMLFASDLRLSRSLDGGKSFDSHMRVNEDRLTSHSFEGLAVAADGTVLLSWIDSHEGGNKAGTYLARVGKQGTQVTETKKLDGDTCVCCRVDVTTGPVETIAVIWRKVFPGDIRDMVLSLSGDSGRSFSSPTLVHADRWQINACPHRGGTVGMDGQGQIYVTWYTEGSRGKPNILFARSSKDRSFTPPQRLDSSAFSIPDHVRMAVNRAGQAIVVWEDSTAVRRQVLARYTFDGGQTFSPVQVLSRALKSYKPDLAVSPSGDFVVVWHEEQFPVIKTVVQTVQFSDTQ